MTWQAPQRPEALRGKLLRRLISCRIFDNCPSVSGVAYIDLIEYIIESLSIVHLGSQTA